MAKSAEERQKAYRDKRPSAGIDGNGERRINTWVKTGASLGLARLAKRYGVTQREILEKMITEADQSIIATLDPDAPEWNEYFSVTP